MTSHFPEQNRTRSTGVGLFAHSWKAVFLLSSPDTYLYPQYLSRPCFQSLFPVFIVCLPPLWLLPSASAPRGTQIPWTTPSAHDAEFQPSWQMIVSLGVMAPALPFFSKKNLTAFYISSEWRKVVNTSGFSVIWRKEDWKRWKVITDGGKQENKNQGSKLEEAEAHSSTLPIF